MANTTSGKAPKIKKISSRKLKKVLEDHQHWLCNDCKGWETMRADLSYTDLTGVNLNKVELRGACLKGARLSRANLVDADLSSADLSFAEMTVANLEGADLRYANLIGSNLHAAILRGACIREANLLEANLSCANLEGAILPEANLSCTDLTNTNFMRAQLVGANLSGADMDRTVFKNALMFNADFKDAKNGRSSGSAPIFNNARLEGAKNVPYIPLACPSEGAFIGWKKVRSRNYEAYLIKLQIPASAKRCSATSEKCRCSKAKVLGIYNLKDGNPAKRRCVANYNFSGRPHTKYEVGKMVYPDSYDEDRWVECTHGIHFFINKQDAINF